MIEQNKFLQKNIKFGKDNKREDSVNEEKINTLSIQFGTSDF